jgi:hypothetical protein
MHVILDLTLAFLLLGVVEAVVKPIAKTYAKRRIVKVLPLVLDWMDDHIYELVDNGDKGPEQLELLVRGKLESLTGESWEDENIDEVFSAFDLRKTFDKLRK